MCFGEVMIQNHVTQKTVVSCILLGVWWFRDKVAFKISLIHTDFSICLPLPSSLIKLMSVRVRAGQSLACSIIGGWELKVA
jgi:hypothetical protein